MATFKVGDRVRIVAMDPIHGIGMEHLIGATGVIVDTSRQPLMFPWIVEHNGGPAGTIYGNHRAAFASCHLAPLVDPGAEAFLETVRRWKPEPVIPLPVKERTNQFR